MSRESVQEPSHPVAEMVQRGLTVMRVENESQQAMAIQRPRDEQKVYGAALKELELVPEFAAEAWYSIPYKDRTDGDEKTVNVEGPSIKAAMALARRWGNCANAARVVDQTEDRIVVEGVFLDYETNLRTLRTVTVSKMRWDKSKKAVIPLRDDRLNMAILAGMSKAARNAILASLPVWLVDGYVDHARKIASGKIKPKDSTKELTPKEKVDFMKGALVRLGTTLPQVEEYINGLTFETDEDVALHLKGLHTAIKDGQAKIEEVFGAPPAAQGAPGTRQVPRSGDLLGGPGDSGPKKF